MIEVSASSSTGRDRENGVRGAGVGGMGVLRDQRQGRRWGGERWRGRVRRVEGRRERAVGGGGGGSRVEKARKKEREGEAEKVRGETETGRQRCFKKRDRETDR